MSGRLPRIRPTSCVGRFGRIGDRRPDFASAWLTLHHQDRDKRLSGEKTRRQRLYKQFILEASTLYADALISFSRGDATHARDEVQQILAVRPDNLQALYLSALIEIGLLLFVLTIIVNGLARLLVWTVGGAVKTVHE